VITVGLSGSFEPQTSGLVAIPAQGVDGGLLSRHRSADRHSENLVIAEHGSNNQGWSLQPQAQARPYGAVPGGIIVACGFNAGGGLTMTNDAINDGRPHRILFTIARKAGAGSMSMAC
jgi:hypothetical protein